MKQGRTRWLAMIGVVAVVAVAGWYVGSQANRGGDDAQPSGAQTATEVYRDIGARVLKVNAEQRIIRLDHERIKGFMNAMTMDLVVADRVDLSTVEWGAHVRFDLAHVNGSYKVVAIRPDKGSSPNPDPQGASTETIDPLERGDRVPDLTLYDASGRRFKLREMTPERKLITFFYVRCPIETYCPTQSRELADLQSRLSKSGSDVHLVSLTLDGSHDGPGVLADYAERFGVDASRWTLAGGEDPVAVRRFADRAGARVRADREGYQIDHALIGLRIEGSRIVDRVFGIKSIVEMAEGM